jgi:hypothetical protein
MTDRRSPSVRRTYVGTHPCSATISCSACELMTMLKVKATSASLDCNSTASVFQESFVSEIEEFNKQDYNDMIDSLICIEDDVEVMNAVLDEHQACCRCCCCC